MRRLILTAGLALFAFPALLATGSWPSPAGRLAHGGFEVLALADGFWTPAGELRFGVGYAEGSLLLPEAALAAPRVRVRLVQRGGGAAHVDRVSLGEDVPLRLDGASEPGALALAARSDRDVLDASGRTLELTFPTARPGTALRLHARVEGDVVVGSPFAFPPANQFQPVTAASAFYSFNPFPAGAAPDWPRTLGEAGALFAVHGAPTTGHPPGATLGWVASDRDTLYAALEFTPDNTRDGAKDWASVHVARRGQVREFRVSEADTRWGAPAFVPTERAAFRHKLYTFAIPFAELGARDAAEAGELKLAFSAYGTAAVSWLTPGDWDFGTIVVGTTSAAAPFTITNTSGVTMTLGTPWYTRGNPAASPFPIAPGTCGDGVVLPASQSCVFHASFAPAVTGPVQDTLTFHAAFGTAPPGTVPLVLNGTGLPPAAVPALGAAGLTALALVLVGAGLWAVRRA
jgi:hypothetical protein